MECPEGIPSRNAACNLPAFYGTGMSDSETRLDLKGMRIAAGLSQDQLGAKLHMEQPNISRIERAARGIAWEVAVRWADACGFDVKVIARDQDALPIGTLPPEVREALTDAVAAWPKIDQPSRRILLAVLKAVIPS